MRVAYALLAASAFVSVASQPRVITDEEEATANASTDEEEATANATTADALLATTWGGFPACRTPSPLLFFGSCLSTGEAKTINNWFKSKIVPELQSYKDDEVTKVTSCAFEQFGTCSAYSSFLRETGVATTSSSQFPRLFFQKGQSRTEIRTAAFADATSKTMKLLRSNGQLGAIQDLVSGISTDAVVQFLYCGVDGGTPTTYIDAANKRQCWCYSGDDCSCTGGRLRDVTGNCRCPVNQYLYRGTCTKCPTGFASPAGDKCVKICGSGFRNKDDNTCEKGCDPGFEVVNGVCKIICDPGSNRVTDTKCCKKSESYENGECVTRCFWKANDDGFRCAWRDDTKSCLKLWADCAITAPVPKDNYVNDKRTNQAGNSRDPLITIETQQSGTTILSKSSSWLDYANSPHSLENNVQLSSFGVFDLALVATDNRGLTKCTGCVAVVDDFRPKSSSPCTCPNQGAPASYSQSELAIAISREQSFSAFYTNVLNNGGEDRATYSNVRCDIKEAKMQDFFEKGWSKLPSLDTQCFKSDFITSLLRDMPRTAPTTCSNTALVCKRCCSKSTTLQEYYYEYKCGEAPSETRKKQPLKGGDDSCRFDYCVQVAADTLITAKVSVTGAAKKRSDEVIAGLPAGPAYESAMLLSAANAIAAIGSTPIEIHEALECLSLEDEGCSFTSTLGALFSRTSEWGSEVAAAATNLNASKFVYWQYSFDVYSGWKNWDDKTELTFTTQLTDLYVAAWTHCGRAALVHFRIVLHVHSDHSVCRSFEELWVEDERNPLTIDPQTKEEYFCNYPRSDFTVMTFQYDSFNGMEHLPDTVKGKYTDVKCYVKVAKAGALVSAIEEEVPLAVVAHTDMEGRIELSQQVALELVRDPTTAKDTEVTVRCEFTFTYYGEGASSVTEACGGLTFTITDCEAPKIKDAGDEAVCEAGKCLDPNVAGMFEACGGLVFGAVGAQTTERSLSGECCSECGNGNTLTCLELDPMVEGGVKRCEVATNIAGVMAEADEEMVESGEAAVYSMGVTLVSVGAMVAALAAVVVARHRGAARAKIASEEDAYYALLN